MTPHQWFIACAAMQQELKAQRWLMKKGVETFCPVIRGTAKKGRTESLPLFKNFVFVYAVRAQLPQLVKRPHIINMVYWMTEPAVVSDDEIGAIRMATNDFGKIELEKIPVIPGSGLIITPETDATNAGESPFSYSGMSIALPSLGFKMTVGRPIGEPATSESYRTTNSWLQRNFATLGNFRLF
jgi:hypothetical protein